MTNRDFSDQVVVITGASGGVGAAAAEELARRGASVVLAARRAGPLGEVAARCGVRAHAVVADVTKRSDVQRLFDAAIDPELRVVVVYPGRIATHVVCDAALGARGDVDTQPNVFTRVREYMEKQPG